MVELIIIGTIIGAGFASGQEIYLFFYRYGTNGIIGAYICSILLGVMLYKILKLIIDNDIKNYKQFLNCIFRRKKSFFIDVNNILINIFLLIGFFIMVSGFSAYLEQEFQINKIICAMAFVAICCIIFLGDVKWIGKVNNILVPILIFVMIFIGIINLNNLKNLFTNDSIMNNVNFYNNWIVQLLIYLSYNLVLLIPILVNLNDKIKKKNILGISIICGIVFLILMISVLLVLSNINNINNIQMPIVYVIKNRFNYLKNVYGVIILSSILTTALSQGISFIKGVCTNKKKYWKVAIRISILAIAISNVGFSNLVKVLYPVIGCLGFIQIIYILKLN